jgi:hypothetical protein
MPSREVPLNGDPAPPVCPPSVAHLQFSNRNIPLLKSHLSHSKQKVAIIFKRNIFRVRRFLKKVRTAL